MTPLQRDALRAAACDACGLMKVLANEDRLLLLCQLLDAEKTVSELESETGIQQPTLSQQLAVLRNEQLVNTRREGKFIYYSLGNDGVRRVLGLLHELFCPPSIGDEEGNHAD